MGSHESVQKGRPMLQKIYAKTWWRVGNLKSNLLHNLDTSCRYTVQID